MSMLWIAVASRYANRQADVEDASSVFDIK